MKEHKIFRAADTMLQKYPKSSLVDIYKSFFQDEYGPGHLLEDMDGAREYFYKELESISSKCCYTLEPCGTGSRFFRAHLDLVLDGYISPGEFFSGFIEGASMFTLPDISHWSMHWEEILEIIKPLTKDLLGVLEDTVFIMAALQTRSGAVQHSRRYAETYDPHYRIIPVGGTLYQKLQGIMKNS